MAAIPLVCVVLFFVFGGVIAAALPGIIGGLTIAGALGIMRLFAEFMPVHFFAQPVVTLMGLGIAVDYGLFMVSRFREELAEGYDTEAAVRRAVMTSGRTIMFSAVILVASSVPLLLFPQGFLKSITYAIIASVMLAAILSITVLPAALAILGPSVDALGVRWLVKFTEPDSHVRPVATRIRTLSRSRRSPRVCCFLRWASRWDTWRASASRQTGEQGIQFTVIGLTLGYITLLGGLFYGVIAMKDADVIGSALYYVLLGIVAFVAIVVVGIALARYVPFARGPLVWWLNWLAEKTQKTKTRAEVEKGFWGKLVNVVMKRPIAFAAPIAIVMIMLIIPLGQLALGGISEKYLPPDNSVREAQEDFDKTFPTFRTEPLTLVIERDRRPAGDRPADRGDPQQGHDHLRLHRAGRRPVEDVATARRRVDRPVCSGDPERPRRPQRRLEEGRRSCGLSRRRAGVDDIGRRHTGFGAGQHPQPVRQAAADGGLLIATTTILMFLAFGSVVLPIKAAVMSALTLGSTMGVLTWMFVDGHGSGLMNYTPQPLMAPMIGLIIAVIWGLSTDYEVFLVSRMVEARERGMSTAEAIRIGTATTGRLITGAALVLAVVAGAFVFSDLVMMKYLAFGLLIALLLDATDRPDVPGAGDHEAARRRLLVGAALDEADSGTPWPRRDRTARRAQASRGARARERSVGRCGRDPRRGQGRRTTRPIRPPRVRHGPGATTRIATPSRTNAPSGAGTTRIPTARPQAASPDEPQTTRLSMAKNAVRNAVNNATRATHAAAGSAAPGPAAARGTRNRVVAGRIARHRARGRATGTAPARPSADATRADARGDPRRSRGQRPRQPRPQPGNEPTTAIPARRRPRPQNDDATTAIPTPRQQDPEAATEKLNTREEDEPKRRGGGLSAQDLLRREGRL